VNDREPDYRHATAAGLAEKREASALPEAAKRDQAIVADPPPPGKGISGTPAELDDRRGDPASRRLMVQAHSRQGGARLRSGARLLVLTVRNQPNAPLMPIPGHQF
jgi:hypothetical protein